MSTGIVARAKSALKMDPLHSSTTSPIQVNTSSSKKSSSSVSQRPSQAASKKASEATSTESQQQQKSSTVTRKPPGRLLHQHQPHEGQSQSSPISTVASAAASRPSRRITASSNHNRVSIQQVNAAAQQAAASLAKKDSSVKKKPSQEVAKSRPLRSQTASTASSKPASKTSVIKEEAKKRDDSPSSTHVNVSSEDSTPSSPDIEVKEEVIKPPSTIEEVIPEVTEAEKKAAQVALRRDTRDMVSPVSTPSLSDVSDNELDSEFSASRTASMASKVKRSESDGIVMADQRPKHEKPPVRRCESIDDATKDHRLMPTIEEASASNSTADLNSFPQNIKTVASATIVKGPEDTTHKIGETLHFLSHYFGNPEPRVIWIKNGQKLNSDGNRTTIKTYSGESTLIVKDLRVDDSGKYEIQIENEVIIY